MDINASSLRTQLVAMVLLFWAVSVNAQSFLCVDEHAVLLDQDAKSKAWKGGFFKDTNTKLVFKPDLEDNKSMAVYSQDNGKLMAKCQHWFADIGVAQCTSQAADVVFKFSSDPKNPQQARFIFSVLSFNYLVPDTSDFGSPSKSLIAQGKCFKVD